MKIGSIEQRVQETSARMSSERMAALEASVKGKKPRDIVPAERMALRRDRLAEADFRPSQRDRERILGTNDLVDVNYLARAQLAAKSVCRIILRDATGREIGYGTGFKIAPDVLMTNHHVLEDAAQAGNAIAEFGYELDLAGRPAPTTRFRLNPGALYLNHESLDFAIVAIDPNPFTGTVPLATFGFLRMQPETGKVNPGEFVTLVQHPAGQPKQIALRENQVLSIDDDVVWYQSDTAQGSSGSAVLNDSWQIVALHHSGVPKKNERGTWMRRDGQPATADTDDADIDWIANEGIRISRIVGRIRQSGGANDLVRQLDQVVTGDIVPESARVAADVHTGTSTSAGVSKPQIEPLPGGARVTVPLSFEIRMSDGAGATAAPEAVVPTPSIPPSIPMDALAGELPVSPLATEAVKPPILDTSYGDRKGYQSDFLDVEVPLPTVKDESRVSSMDDGDYEIPYQNFTVVMDKRRRLALYAASNVDASEGAREPEPGRRYTRKSLGGFGENDREQWVTDPRIPENHQLPDVFFTKDRQSFDKGHLVRREDVCFGSSYRQIQRANGDTYHTTNCTPQVADFNQAGKGGLWGKLEDEVLKQAKNERYCLFAGPLLREKDRVFEGIDQRGPVRVKIPSAYWKIVVAVSDDEVHAFAFLLEQNLENVAFEFSVPSQWKRSMLSIARLEQRIGALAFPDVVHEADQFGKKRGQELARATGFSLAEGPSSP